MFNFVYTKWYFFIIIIFIMPLNGYLMATNSLLYGLILTIVQIPYILLFLNKFYRAE